MSDEVNLVDLWRVIAKRKAVLLSVLLISVAVSVAYLVLAEPIYKASAYLLPPRDQEIQELLIGFNRLEEGTDENGYTPQIVYQDFIENLKSQAARREFFDSHNLLGHYVSDDSGMTVDVDRVFESKFNKRLRVEPDKKDPMFVSISFDHTDRELAAEWLNDFVNFANRRTVSQLSSDVAASVQAEIEQIDQLLSSKLKLAQQRRLDTISRLAEALSIAQSLGIKDANSFATAVSSQGAIAVNTADVPLYMRGAQALQMEIAVLESRKSDEPFISGFRDLQERRAFLEGIAINPENLSAFTLDGPASVPHRAERPRKALTIALGIVLGIVAGVFAAFAVELVYKARETGSADPS